MPDGDTKFMTRDELLKLAKENAIQVKDSILTKDLSALLGMKLGIQIATEYSTSAPAKPKRDSADTRKSRPRQTSGRGEDAKPQHKRHASTKPRAAYSKHLKESTGSLPPDDPTRSGELPKPAMLDLFEDKAQEAKFVVAGPEVRDEAFQEPLSDLPEHYGGCLIVLLPLDPYRAHAFWELPWEKIQQAAGWLGGEDSTHRVLRVNRISGDGSVKNSYDVEIHPHAKSWYLRMDEPGAKFFIQIGLKNSSGQFESLAESNALALPPGRPSDRVDDKWTIADGEFRKIYALSGGQAFGVGDQEGRGDSPENLQGFSSGGSREAGSFSASRFSSASKKKQSAFRVDAELILYGRAEPGDRVRLAGREIHLQEDGAFSTRLAFPEGDLSLKVSVESTNGTQTQNHVIEVRRSSLKEAAPTLED